MHQTLQGGAGTATDSVSSTFADGEAYVNTSGSTVIGTAQGHADGLAASLTYTWHGQGNYLDSVPGTAGLTFPFVKNTGSESGTHVCKKTFLVPAGYVVAQVSQTNPLDWGEAYACISVLGSATLDTIDGHIVQ